MCWVYVPGLEPSASGSELLNLECAKSLTWRSKHPPVQHWSRAWKRGGFIRLLSGLTCEPSTLERGAAQWIASCREIPARATASPESASAPTTIGGCLTAPSRSLIKAGLTPSSARTSRGTSTGSSPSRSLHWKDWAVALRAEYSVRPRPELATDASASSSWPTATVMSQAQTAESPTPGQTGGTTLAGAAQQWQTPSAQQFEAADLDRLLERQAECKAKGINGNGFGLTLANELQIWARDQWATPCARDHFPAHTEEYVAAKRAQGHGMRNLNDEAAHWPTPAARDHKGANSAEHVTTNGTGRMHMDQLPNFVEHAFQPSLPVQPTSDGPTSSPERRTLNPLFVEWLMGWPEGLSGFDTAGTASCLCAPRWHGCDCIDCWLNRQREALAHLLAIKPPPQGQLF